MVLLQWANLAVLQQIRACVYMHGVILLAIFVEAGVKVLGSEVTLKEPNLTQMAE